MINKVLLRDLLDLPNRRKLYDDILNKFRAFSNVRDIHYYEFETSEGKIPIIVIAKTLNPEEVRYVKVFVGAQHNEYNGLFGIIEFFKMIEKSIIRLDAILKNNQILIFTPLMNPYGFLNPKKDNKSGYYLKNGTNLNRFWRRSFALEYKNNEDNLNQYPIPEHVTILHKFLEKYWKRESIPIYILDFHETSLLDRFLADLTNNLQKNSITYKFSHWLKEGIIKNIIKLYNMPYSRKLLFYKCNPNADHTHINLSIKQLEIIHQNLQEYVSQNHRKLPFYFSYSNKSKEICERLALNVYNRLKDILWETYFPAFNHYFLNHGCFVNMNDVIKRKGVYCMELESAKQFFNIFDEIDNSKTDFNYFENKIKIIKMSTQLVVESIKEMLKCF
ncbi:MAG: hypothetical protein ACFFG0_21215 [Candidatus Thorarchaeota archaeon]